MKGIFVLTLVFFSLLFKDEITAWISPPFSEKTASDPLFDDDSGEGISFGELDQRRQESETRAQMIRDQAKMRKQVARPINRGVRPKEESFVIDVREHTVSDDDALMEGGASVDGEINALLAERQQMDEMTEARKREYAKGFIQRARQKGFDVKMNRDFQIISIKKIKTR